MEMDSRQDSPYLTLSVSTLSRSEWWRQKPHTVSPHTVGGRPVNWVTSGGSIRTTVSAALGRAQRL